LSLSKCTSIDYLWINSCGDCTQAAWCGLTLQSITGKDPTGGLSLYVYTTAGITSMCGMKQVKGGLPGGLVVTTMNSLTSLDGTEGITSVGVATNGDTKGYSIYLSNDPVLNSACALTNARFPANTLVTNKLDSVPSAWPATDSRGGTIPHGTTCPSSGILGSEGEGGIIGIVIGAIVALVCVVGFLYYRSRRSEPIDDKAQPLLGNDSLGIEMEALQASEVETYRKEEATAERAVEKAILQSEGVNEIFLTRQIALDLAAPTVATTLSTGRSEIDFDELKLATSGFDQSLEIGDGGSCRVYRATIDSTPCAIKVLADDAAEWEATQFTAEVNLLRRVQHPNLCRLYASSTNGPRKCLVLELMEGGALDKRLVAQPPLGWQQRVSIALGTCRGLVYLHSLSPPMIHRDVSLALKRSLLFGEILLPHSPLLLFLSFVAPD
jgi:hypothetical protein